MNETPYAGTELLKFGWNEGMGYGSVEYVANSNERIRLSVVGYIFNKTEQRIKYVGFESPMCTSH